MGSIAGSIATVHDGDLINHYGMFVAHLETLFIKSSKKRYPSILDSKEIIQSILQNENNALFYNVKVIIHLFYSACVKVSVESVVEGLVSYEKYFDSLFTNIGRNDHC